MIRHTLLLRFDHRTPPPACDAVLLSLIALCDQVGEVDSIAFGPEADPQVRVQGFTHAFTVVFGSEAAHDAFHALPGYAAALEPLRAAEAVQVAPPDFGAGR
ncbi:Dabb family protein [Methylobacterium sp. J-026]|uniref:Dabb family protein n=1 Tax=Methylobacterium sp. J-026 TaxID=2836624 RepID=UPI001FBA64E8|nr:Dabb family protein [Methylobacterium sp. J-026]MCJ2134419.1 Dabb family protein [Methylobacterium sp. J-026]